jgi:hypothetical protein
MEEAADRCVRNGLLRHMRREHSFLLLSCSPKRLLMKLLTHGMGVMSEVPT